MMINKFINYISQHLLEIRQEKLGSFLKSKNAKIRRFAKYQIEHPGVYDVYIDFINLITRPIRKLFQYLLSPLNRLLERARYNLILDKVSSDDHFKRQEAIPKLAEYPTEEAFNILVNLLDDESYDIRFEAVETLWVLNNKKAIEPLKEAYNKEVNGFNKIMISLCLLSMGDTSTFSDLFDNISENSVQNDHWDMTDLVTSSLSKDLGDDAIPYLEKGLRHSDWHVRWISIRVIGDLAQTKETLKHYMFLRDDPFPEIRRLYTELL